MKKIRVGDLQEGMIIAADVFETGVVINIPFIRKGVVLNKDYIERLKGRGIGYVLIETPQGYRGARGEVLSLEAAETDIVFDGKVQINGSVMPYIKIEAGERVIVEGDVAEGCIIHSATGGVMVKGSVNGTREDPVKITSAQNILIQSAAGSTVSFADLKTEGDISISGIVYDSSLSAPGEISVEGKVIRSQVYTQSRIRVRECGDEHMEPSVLMVKPSECRALSQEILKLDSRVVENMKEKERLQNTIDLVKKLGKDIEQLPQEKKVELAKGIKRFKEIDGELAALQARKAELKGEIEQHLSVKRIMVIGPLYPRTRISIDNSSTEITAKVLGVAFHVKDFKVVSLPYTGGF